MAANPPDFPLSGDSKARFAEKPSKKSSGDELARRLAFLQLGPDDAERLRQLGPLTEPQIDEFVDGFYGHLFQFAETARHLRDPDLVKNLKESQKAHFRSLLRAQWDENFLHQRRRVGWAHAEAGVEPEHFLGSYNLYSQFFFRRLMSDDDLPERSHLEGLLSLLKAVFLDVGLTLDAYFAESTSQLQRALEMLWEANLELRQFAQLASHDLKTPLATVANLCDEAVDEFGEQMPEEARQLIESAAKQAFRLSRLIDELLASALMPESTEANEVVASDEVIHEAIGRLQPVFARCGIEVEVAPDLPKVWGNRVRLREAFYNLLSNAAKFIDSRPGRIEISYTIGDNCCTFCVADNGPGIPTEELERIFAPFRRLSTRSERPGTGLGLYFTRNLIERQGGRVWAESEPGKGSRFYVKLKQRPESPRR